MTIANLGWEFGRIGRGLRQLNLNKKGRLGAALFITFFLVELLTPLSSLSSVLPSAFSSFLKCAFSQPRSGAYDRACRGQQRNGGLASTPLERRWLAPDGPFLLPTP